MNYNKTLILSLVLAALAAAVFLWELPAEKAKQAKEIEGEKIADINYEKVNRIELQHGSEILEFTKEKTGDEWTMTKPMADQAERWMVQSLISAFRFARPSRTLDNVADADLVRFGLDKPRAIVTLDAGGVVKRFRVGITNSIDRSAYVRPEDRNVVFLIADSTLSAIEKPISDFRRQELLAVRDPSLKLARVTLERPGQPPLAMMLEKPAKNETTPEEIAAPEPAWRLDGPDGPIVDEEAMKRIVDQIGLLKTKSFDADPSADLAKYGLDKPSLIVTAVYGEGDQEKTSKLTVGKLTENAADSYAEVSGRPYLVRVQQTALKPFETTRDDLRDRRLLPNPDPKRVAIIDLQSPKASFRIARSGAGWTFASGAPANAERADELLQAAAKWRAEELVGGPRGARLAQAAPPETTLSLAAADGKTLATIRFSKAVDPDQLAPAAPRPAPAGGAKAAVEATPTGAEKAIDKERLVARVEGGYPDTLYLVKATTLSDLPANAEEIKATATPEPAAKAGEAATPAAGAAILPK